MLEERRWYDQDEIDCIGPIALLPYYPWRLPDGSNNPHRNDDTRRFLNLKNPAHPKHEDAVRYFASVLNDWLPNFFEKSERVCWAIIPSHEKGITSVGLKSVLFSASKGRIQLVNGENVLERTNTVDRLSTGGDRSIDVHLATIGVCGHVQGQRVLLLDDISTSGNSLVAGVRKLYKAGAAAVVPISLGKTSH